jgi:hypothetical protein
MLPALREAHHIKEVAIGPHKLFISKTSKRIGPEKEERRETQTQTRKKG